MNCFLSCLFAIFEKQTVALSTARRLRSLGLKFERICLPFADGPEWPVDMINHLQMIFWNFQFSLNACDLGRMLENLNIIYNSYGC